MNRTLEESLGSRIPMSILTGETIDISIFLVFLFWDFVYVPRCEGTDYSRQIGSQKSDEICRRFVGFLKDVGHGLTFKVLTDNTRKVIHCSRVRLVKTGENNLCLDKEAGEVPDRVFICSGLDKETGEVELPMVRLDTDPFSIAFDDEEQANDEVDSVPDHKDQDHAHPYLLSRDKIACSGTNVSDPAAPWKSVIFKEPVSELHTKLCIEIQDTPPKTHDETQDMPPMHGI